MSTEDLRLPPYAPGLRIGLFGGSFNPAHDGHRMASLTALRRLQLDRVWWLVSPGNPLKDNRALPPLAQRIAFARNLADHGRIHKQKEGLGNEGTERRDSEVHDVTVDTRRRCLCTHMSSLRGGAEHAYGRCMTATVSGINTDELSTEIRPQDDLFRYVNGAWMDRTEIPEDKARWGSFHLIAEQAEHDVRAIIEESQGAVAGTEARKIGDLYSSFMDTERINAAGASPLAGQLARVAAIDSIPTLLRTIGELEREGVSGLFGAFIEPDPGDPTRYVPFLVQGGITLPDESYFHLENFAELRTQYRTHIEALLALAGVADAAAAADRIFALEAEIAGFHWDKVASRDAVNTYNLKSWAEVQTLAGVDLEPWRDAVAPGKAEAFAEVVVYQPSFLEGLGSLLTAERLGDLRSWLQWKVVHGAAAFLSDDFVAESFAFYGTALSGVPVNRERWKRGVGLTEAALGEAIGLDPKFAYNIIKTLGNYGEIFDRNIGPKTPVGFERGYNQLWTKGGLLYSPPFR